MPHKAAELMAGVDVCPLTENQFMFHHHIPGAQFMILTVQESGHTHLYTVTNTHGYTHRIHIEALWLWPVTASMQPIFLHLIWLHSSKEDLDQTLQNQPRSDLDDLVNLWPNTSGSEAS